jgi:hypothetical protein
MADKQLLLKKNADAGLFADDDPLAELARIVGYEQPGSAKPVRAFQQRQEPLFDLEDELLKEFELYDAPSRDVSPAIRENPVPVPAVPEIAAEPVRDIQEPEAEPVVATSAPRPAVLDLEDEILREFAAFDARRSSRAPVVETKVEDVVPDVPQPESVEAAPDLSAVRPTLSPLMEDMAPLMEDMAPQMEDMAPLMEDVAPLKEDTEAAPQVAANDHLDQIFTQTVPETVEQKEEPAVADEPRPIVAEEDHPASEPDRLQTVIHGEDAESLIVEDQAPIDIVEDQAPIDDGLSVVESHSQAVEPAIMDTVPPVLAVSAPYYEETEEYFPEPEVDEEPELYVESEEPVVSPADEDRYLADNSGQDVVNANLVSEPVTAPEQIAAPEPIQEQLAVAALAEPAISAVAQSAAPVLEPAKVMVAQQDYGLDDLLADAEHFSTSSADIGPARRSAPIISPVVPERREPIFTPVPPAFEPDIENWLQETAVEGKAPEQAKAAGSFDEVSDDDEVGEFDPFDESAFELDLGDIELDLQNVDANFPGKAAAKPGDNPAVSAGKTMLAEMADVSVATKPGTTESWRVAETQRPLTPVVEDYSSLPFDPTQIAGEEEAVETLAEMDVPVVSAEPDVGPIVPAEYDIDIDAEMAHLIVGTTGPATPGAMSQASASPDFLPDPRNVPASPKASPPSMDLDEFEKALEEDFRRSLQENSNGNHPDRLPLTPGVSYEPEVPTKNRTLLWAAAAAIVIIAGGAGAYVFLSGKSEILASSSEPRIILADKDPVKVAPVDKGGQTVPNQDKAVYDRVSGENTSNPKQQNLVTTSEQPVDVVQKTLMPENMPLDDDTPTATSTQDTADPRLLPDNGIKTDAKQANANQNVSTAGKDDNAVVPHKVRTMIVRADGTLVPREDTPAVADATTQTATATDISGDKARSVDVPVATTDTNSADTNTASVDTNTAADTTKTDAATVDAVPDRLPATANDQTAAAIKDAEIKQAVPVATDTAAAKTDEAAPATTATTDNTALADAANANVADSTPVRVVKTSKIVGDTPIPANRPVDQPVNVVGTVTDQGHVENSAKQKTTDVASANTTDTQPVTQTALPAGTYVIQIASLPSEADARASYNKLAGKFPGIIGGHGVDIKKADIAGKGTYYRVRIPAGSKQEAISLCTKYKAAGGSCLVSR